MKIISQLQGGIGNQLFSYSAGRSLSIRNSSEFILDIETAFERDHKYGWKFSLEPFPIVGRIASRSEMLKPLPSLRRRIITFFDYFSDYSQKRYIRQEFGGFDKRIFDLPALRTRWLDGIWNSELYFKDQRRVIYNDLKLDPKLLGIDPSLEYQLKNENSIAIHFRFFSNKKNYTENLQETYYKNAIQYLKSQIVDPQFYIFSDDVDRAQSVLMELGERGLIFDHKSQYMAAQSDLFLMSNCRHIIAANSTFSWWGAWLGEFGQDRRLTIVPDPKVYNQPHWILPDLLPERWTKIG